MKTLLIVAHTPSENTKKLLQSVCFGANFNSSNNLNIQVKQVSEVNSQDIITCDALILGLIENLGYLSGLMKDMFDKYYCDWLNHKNGLPYAFYLRAKYDGAGSIKAIKSITTGLKWKLIQSPLILKGKLDKNAYEKCNELGQTISLSLDLGLI